MASKRLTPEEAISFVYSFASAFSTGAMPAFKVETSKTKNRFFFRIKTKDNLTYGIKPFTAYELDEVGTFGGIDSLFKKAHPRIMLREQLITFDELAEEFNLDKAALAAVIVKKLKNTITSTIKSYSWKNKSKMSFHTFLGHECYDNSYWVKPTVQTSLGATTEVSNIEELIVWADLNNGVH